MPLEREKVLLDNFLKSLDLYQRCIIWAMTASAVFFLLSLRLRDQQQSTVDLLYTKISIQFAWGIALLLFFLLGIFALSTLNQAEGIFTNLKLSSELREAVLLYPSLATHPYGFFRVGSALFCPIAIVVGFAIEIQREWKGQNLHDQPWGGLLMFASFIILLYGRIAQKVWSPFGGSLKNL